VKVLRVDAGERKIGDIGKFGGAQYCVNRHQQPRFELLAKPARSWGTKSAGVKVPVTRHGGLSHSVRSDVCPMLPLGLRRAA
jgi:hypothetical protein